MSAYSRAQAALHWLTAALLVALVVIGFVMTGAEPESALRLGLSRAHALLGGATAVTLVARLLVRARSPKVDPLPMSRPRRALMRAVHLAMYLALLAVLASGVATSVGGDWASYLLGQAPSAPDLGALHPRQGHGRLVVALMILIGAHVVGVLVHEVRHGGALRRMLAPRGGAGASEPRTSTPDGS